MGPRTRAAIFTQRGSVEPAKQIAACLDFINEQRWTFRHYAPSWAPGAAAELARAGAVDVIVTAYDSRAAQQLAAEVGDRARVMYVHPQPTEIDPPPRRLRAGVAELVLRWWRRGNRSVEQIAADIEADTRDVRDILRRGGEHPDRSD